MFQRSLFLLCLYFIIPTIKGSEAETYLQANLKENYSKDVLPVSETGEAVRVLIQLVLQYIIEVVSFEKSRKN
jgi:hypothetical protein